MSADAATLDLLIRIREDLAGLKTANQGMRDFRKDAEGVSAVLKNGLGIGTGMELARRGIDLLRSSLQESVGDAFRLAEEIRDQSQALQVSGEAYQVLRRELAAASVDAGRLTMAITSQNQSLAPARLGAGAAADAYKALNLNATQLENLSPDQRLISVARATLNATDKTRAFQAAGQILGSRGLPQLLSALRSLATDGYDKVAESARSAGQVMSDDTAQKLDDAKKSLERLDNLKTVVTGTFVGETMGFLSALRAHPWDTIKAAASMPFGAAGLIGLSTYARLKAPASIAAPASPPPPALADRGALLQAQIAGLGQGASFVQNNPLNTERETRAALIPILREQVKLYSELAKEQFGDRPPEFPGANATEEQINKYKLWLDLNAKQVDVMHQLQAVSDTPLQKLGRDLADTTGLITDTLQNQINPAISSLSTNIWGAMSGTGKWSDTFRGLGNIAGQVLTDLMVKLLIVRPLLSLFGISNAAGGAPAGIKVLGEIGGNSVASAGGGTFVTNGPTHFTVGDNPGGVELVNVIPLSGVGRTTVRGASARMAGGGSMLVGGGGARGGNTYYIDATGADASKMAELFTYIRSIDGTLERRSVAASIAALRRGGSAGRALAGA